jgi:hypothetical protein
MKEKTYYFKCSIEDYDQNILARKIITCNYEDINCINVADRVRGSVTCPDKDTFIKNRNSYKTDKKQGIDVRLVLEDMSINSTINFPPMFYFVILEWTDLFKERPLFCII